MARSETPTATAHDLAADVARVEGLVEAGELDAARAAAAQLAEQAPGHAATHNLLGVIAYRETRLSDALRAFESACECADADDDVRSNRDHARAGLEALAAAREPRRHDGTLLELHGGLHGPLAPRLLGRALSGDPPQATAERLDDLPTATMTDERRFLLRFAATFWDGRGDVFENGPLLGGSTRALAIGMLAHPDRDPAARLHTHDWFTSRVPLDLPPGTFEHLVQRGLISAADLAEMNETGTFLGVYRRLHAGHDYSPLVRPHVAYLPGAPGDVPVHGEAIFEPPPGRTFSLVFIDGCKSWYGTRHWIERMCDRVPAGSHFIFQDYGWYTCFWLPVLIGRLPEHFRLVAHVDNTYAFELTRPLDAEEVLRRFPEHPRELGRDTLSAIFSTLLADAGRRGDTYHVFALNVQFAASLAYLDRKDEARRHIAALLADRPEFSDFRNLARSALRSPTYTPDGESILL
jgi:hypothetical protein